jgi:hypothetical protein
MDSAATLINLSRALKLKNRMVQRLSELDGLIATYNSRPEGEQEYDVRQLYRDRLELAMQLVEVKTAISRANQPVQKLIFELAECKSLIANLRKVETRHGTVAEGYAGTKINYVAQFRKPDVDREVRRVEKEIDRRQDELDRFNYNTNVSVDRRLLVDFGSEARPDEAR